MGRSVNAWGYWGDILNSPYHCFGTVSEDPSLFKITNKQFGRTAVDVAEHNVLVCVAPPWLLISSLQTFVPNMPVW